MSRTAQIPKLLISNLGPIKRADVSFGDLTVFVGPQASGKSVMLQMLKLAVDYRVVAATLRKQGLDWSGDGTTLLELFLGEGMGNLWRGDTKMEWNGVEKTLASFLPGAVRSDSVPKLFYIPAHRVLTLRNGWPRHFGDYAPGDPYVVQDFSEQLRLLMGAGLGSGENIFPQVGRLTDATRTLLKRGIFGDFDLKVDKSGAQKRLVLQRKGEKPLPFMAWSAGQREFSPLLLGLYYLMPSAGSPRRAGLDWLVLEEPEMGLHPRAITAVLFLVLELMQRGYRVCISTHSPHVLDMVWALQVFISEGAPPETLLKLFDVAASPKNKEIAADILGKRLKVYYFDRDGSDVVDISQLDADSEKSAERTWGGMTEFSARASDVVADFIATKKQS